jgi:DNA-binding CsgD family transcriptional regulator
MTATPPASMAAPDQSHPVTAAPAAQPWPTASTSARVRLTDVSPECRRLLHIGAVLGPSFTAEEVLAMLREPVAVILQPLEEALRSGLLLVSDQALRFPDEIVRQEVLGTLEAPVLRLLRHEVETLRSRGPEASADESRGHSLTPGELRIAELVARGFTNRQIATRVFLSPHTVNYHLRQVFRKLGISSRAELAALVRSELITGLAPRPE